MNNWDFPTSTREIITKEKKYCLSVGKLIAPVYFVTSRYFKFTKKCVIPIHSHIVWNLSMYRGKSKLDRPLWKKMLMFLWVTLILFWHSRCMMKKCWLQGCFRRFLRWAMRKLSQYWRIYWKNDWISANHCYFIKILWGKNYYWKVIFVKNSNYSRWRNGFIRFRTKHSWEIFLYTQIFFSHIFITHFTHIDLLWFSFYFVEVYHL